MASAKIMIYREIFQYFDHAKDFSRFALDICLPGWQMF